MKNSSCCWKEQCIEPFPIKGAEMLLFDKGFPWVGDSFNYSRGIIKENFSE
jgi:hypothetical protein